MAIDSETFRWCAGGFFTAMSVISGIAYHDPNFFLSWVFKKLIGATLFIGVFVFAFWGGARLINDYVNYKLSIPIDQTEKLLTTYNKLTDILFLLIIGAFIAYFWVLGLHSLSVERQKKKSP